MEQYCDLHTHSVFSDGTDTPARLIALAREASLAAVALCDHNTVAGLPDFLAAARGSGVEAVPGVEISTDYAGKELHILALFVSPRHYDDVSQLLADGDIRKEQSNIDLVAALNRAGFPLDYERIRAGTPQGHINRAHIAAEMLHLGYVQSVQEAFRLYLAPERGYYRPPRRPDACRTVCFIRSIGAVAVLAHPFLSMDEALLRVFLREAVPCGLNAMEVAYSKYSEATARLAARIAREYGILPSGGSDYHGTVKPDISIGTGRGMLRVPMAWLESLRPD